MTLPPLTPDPEAVVIAYLNGVPEIADLARDGVGTQPPRSIGEPFVRVTAFDPIAVGGSRTDRLIEVFMQFDCYAGESNSSVEASELSRTLRAALTVMPGAHDDAVVTGTEITGGAHVPDPDGFHPARERYTVDATVWMRRR